MDKTPKNNIIAIILLVNAIVWYLCFFSFLKNESGITGNDFITISAINLIATCFGAILSVKILQKVRSRLKFITAWTAIGIVLSLLPLLVGSSFSNFIFISNAVGPINPSTVPFVPFTSSFVTVAFISGIIGLYCGFGAPVLLGYYSTVTKSINRAKISGLVIFLTCTSFVPVILLARSPVSTAVTLAVWKLCGLLAIILLKPSETKIYKEDTISYKSILKTREIILYLIPWLMFSMVNNFAIPALNIEFGSSIITPLTMAENVIAGIFAVITGFIADRFGRKRLLFLGFTLMGFGCATLGLFPLSMSGLYFYTLVDGIAWGIFTTLFILTIWSDIAGERNAEKFFIIGILPYMFSVFLQIVFDQFMANSVIDFVSIFFFLSIFLFIAVTPLYLAPETLSKKDKRANDLRSYLVQAQKKVEKEANAKKQRKKQDTPLTDDSGQT